MQQRRTSGAKKPRRRRSAVREVDIEHVAIVTRRTAVRDYVGVSSGNTSAMPQKSDTFRCMTCGTSLPPEARFCLWCGARLVNANTVEPSLDARRLEAPSYLR